MTQETQNPIVTPEQLELAIRLGNIFMPYATRQRQGLFGNEPNPKPAKFVHYTTAESALNIIKSKRFWMRNTNCMSDYREVQHGFDIFRNFFCNEDKLKAFTEALDGCALGSAQEAIGLFDQNWDDVRLNTYITSLSEHDAKENSYGRLSMWRAFGGNIGRVGLVLNVPWFSLAPLALNLQFSPVAYLSESSAHEVLDEIIANICSNRDFLSSVERPILVKTIFFMLLAGVVCLKHEGFHEEREWRAIYAPKRWPSPLMESSTEVIGGIPQIVHKIPLDSRVSAALSDLDLPTMIDRLIVGPTRYPWAMYEAFVAELLKAGVSDAENRVFVSDIPIRA